PELVVLVWRWRAWAVLVRETLAAETAAPDLSTTVPRRDVVPDWARINKGVASASSSVMAAKIRMEIREWFRRKTCATAILREKVEWETLEWEMWWQIEGRTDLLKGKRLAGVKRDKLF